LYIFYIRVYYSGAVLIHTSRVSNQPLPARPHRLFSFLPDLSSLMRAPSETHTPATHSSKEGMYTLACVKRNLIRQAGVGSKGLWRINHAAGAAVCISLRHRRALALSSDSVRSVSVESTVAAWRGKFRTFHMHTPGRGLKMPLSTRALDSRSALERPLRIFKTTTTPPQISNSSLICVAARLCIRVIRIQTVWARIESRLLPKREGRKGGSLPWPKFPNISYPAGVHPSSVSAPK
jgi:hypothetical protein